MQCPGPGERARGAPGCRVLQGALLPCLVKLGGYRWKPQAASRALAAALTAQGMEVNVTAVVFALCASLEGEGAEVSEAVQPGMVHEHTGAAGRGLSRPTAQSLNMHLK